MADADFGRGPAHGPGLGAGDVNGDGRIDVLQAAGWWEQPAPARVRASGRIPVLRRWGRSEGAGGSEMVVFDVNGDKLNDVVAGLNAHGFGLAWFEQKRDSSGRITFERHMIIDDYSTKNTGGVTITEMHGATMADIDGDPHSDFLTGKLFSHQESWVDPDPYGEAVLYLFRTCVHNSGSGRSRIRSELIHNKSGVGSHLTAVDLNGDGLVDIVTSTNRGTFIFWGSAGDSAIGSGAFPIARRRRRAAAAARPEPSRSNEATRMRTELHPSIALPSNPMLAGLGIRL